MTDSFRKIDYRLRPAKHAERAMIIDLIKRMRFAQPESYRYIGLGSVAFIDHRMIHRATGSNDLISFEGTDNPLVQKRFEKNVPLSCIKMQFGMSYDVLPTMDLSIPSIIWLDYDDQISRWMINDVETVAAQIPAGSLVAVTFATSFPTEGDKREAELVRLQNHFPEYITDETKPSELENAGLASRARMAFSELFNRALSDADVLKEPADKRTAEQVIYFRYRDGAPMCTIGWVIVSDNTRASFDASAFEGLQFHRSGEDAFVIRIPKVTPFEIREMERLLPNLEDAEIEWIPPSDRRDFASLYRYLPTFGSVEPV